MRQEASVALAGSAGADLAGRDAEIHHSITGQVVEFLAIAAGAILGMIGGVWGRPFGHRVRVVEEGGT